MSGRRTIRPGAVSPVAGAVLFDMDGVLVDTEGMKARAHSETIAEFGGELPPETYSEWMGRSQREVQAGFAAAAGLDVPHDRYLAAFTRIYRRLLDAGVQTTPGARALLTDLRGHGCRLGLVTSSQAWMLDHVVREAGLVGLFDVQVSAEDVVREKPAPDAYLQALARLGVPAAAAVVVEDTEAGVTAAVRAGCPVIAIRHRYNGLHDFGAAVEVIAGLLPTASVSGTIRSTLSH